MNNRIDSKHLQNSLTLFFKKIIHNSKFLLRNRNHRMLILSALLLYAFFLRFLFLDYYEIWGTDEGYYMVIARNCLEGFNYWLFPSHDFPNFDVDKPPFFFWLTASSYLLLGVSKFSARLPVALLGVGSIFMTYLIGSRIYNYKVGILSSFILTLIQSHLKYSRLSMMEIPLTFLMLVTILLLILGIQKNKPFFIILGGIPTGIAFLTKLWPAFLPYVIILPYVFLRFQKINEKLKLVFNELLSLTLAITISFSWILLTDWWGTATGYNLIERFMKFEFPPIGLLIGFFWGTEMGYWIFPSLFGLAYLLYRKKPVDTLVSSWMLLPTLFYSLASLPIPGAITPPHYFVQITPPAAIVVSILIIDSLNSSNRILPTRLLNISIALSLFTYLIQPSAWPIRLTLNNLFDTRSHTAYNVWKFQETIMKIIEFQVLLIAIIIVIILILFLKFGKYKKKKIIIIFLFLSYPAFEETLGLYFLPDYHPNPFSMPSGAYRWHNVGFPEIGQYLRNSAPINAIHISSHPETIIFYSRNYNSIYLPYLTTNDLKEVIQNKETVYIVLYSDIDDIKHPELVEFIDTNFIEITSSIKDLPINSPLKVFTLHK
jgi:4-amino-4-deoxy-L-arabinose transferase-like glycosyltransferase